MIGYELSTCPEDFRDRRRLRVLHLSQGHQDAKAQVAILPVAGIEPVHLGLSLRDIVSGLSIDPLFVDEPVLQEFIEMVPGRADGEAQRPNNGSEMISREEPQVVVDLTTHGMVESRQESQAEEERRTPTRKIARVRSRCREHQHAEGSDGADERVPFVHQAIEHDPSPTTFIRSVVFQCYACQRRGDLRARPGADFLRAIRSPMGDWCVSSQAATATPSVLRGSTH